MSRPSANIILQAIDDNEIAYEVCEADALFAVCYLGRPIQVRKRNLEVPYPGPKYIKTCFPNSGHAFNLAEKLNLKFNSDRFSVAIVQVSRFIKE
jgi:hypothetical protein